MIGKCGYLCCECSCPLMVFIGKKKVHFGELLKSLDSTDAALRKHLNQQDGSKKLPQPLEKIHVKKASYF